MNFRKHALSAAALIALVGAAAPATVAAQSTDFTWYGRIDLGLENSRVNNVTRTMVNNYASRLGIKGEHKFNDALSGIFQVETGVAPDDTAQSKTFANRNSFLGLKSAVAGQFIVGTHDMPLKSLEGTTGVMWGQGDLAEILVHGKGTKAAVGSTFSDVHTRQKNVLLYTSPKFANAVVAKLAFSPDEGKTPAAGANGALNKSVFGASIEYNDGTFNAGLATQTMKQFNGALAAGTTAFVPGLDMKATKLTFGAKMGDWSAGAALSKLDNGAGRKTSNVVVTGTYALGTTTLKGSFGKSGESASGANDGIKGLALQADYALDKQTTLYGSVARLSNDANAKATFVGSDNFPAVATGGNDPRILGVGIRYVF